MHDVMNRVAGYLLGFEQEGSLQPVYFEGIVALHTAVRLDSTSHILMQDSHIRQQSE
jgi:hypothetical protein